MGVSHVSYAAEGWGVGELTFDGPRLVWHELPRPSATVPDLTVADLAVADIALASTAERAGGAAPTTFPPMGGARAPAVTISRKSSPVRAGSGTKFPQEAAALAKRVVRALAGRKVTFDDVELELEWCTPFQRALVDAIRRVPWGEVVTYAELAALAGRPRAPRAAGTFCAQNRFPLVLPCHRVVAAAGLGGYGSLGAGYKRRLLALEGRADL